MNERRPVETPPWLERYVRLLDDFLRIPGTDARIGLDAILGFFFPGVGDALTGAGALSLLFMALRARVPTVVLLRMVVNIAIDTVLGVVPIAGDVFDVFWRSNRRNLDLIEKYRADPSAKPAFADYVVVALGILFVVLSIVLPLLLVGLLGTVLLRYLGIANTP